MSVAPYQKEAGSGLWQQVSMSVGTNAAGDYDLGGLKAGTYRLGFSTYSGGHIAEYWDDADSVESATDIVVGASATVAGKNAQLAAGSHITGRVTGPDGAGLGNVSVVAYQKSAGSTYWSRVSTGSSSTTDASGAYDLSGLKAGTYRIGFSTYSGGYLAEFWDDAATVNAATDIVVGESATVSGKNAQLAAGSHITGKVTGPDGAALQGVSVSAYEKTAGSIPGTWS